MKKKLGTFIVVVIVLVLALPVLNLIAVAALAMAVSSIMGRILMAADRELLTLRIAIVNTVIQIVAGMLMTTAFGLEALL